jgi:hypothetical protein
VVTRPMDRKRTGLLLRKLNRSKSAKIEYISLWKRKNRK